MPAGEFRSITDSQKQLIFDPRTLKVTANVTWKDHLVRAYRPVRGVGQGRWEGGREGETDERRTGWRERQRERERERERESGRERAKEREGELNASKLNRSKLK